MSKQIKFSVSSRESDNPNYSKQDLNKKYFTDYQSRYKASVKDYGRNTLYWGKSSLQQKFITEINEESISKLSLFEQPKLEHKSQAKTDKDFHVDGVYSHLSISELVLAINAFSIQNRFSHHWMKQQVNILKNETTKTGIKVDIPTKIDYKSKGLVISKRLLSGGISAIKNSICDGSPYLFFDIDIKPNENPKLFSENGIPNKLNNQVFACLKDIAVLIARSSSGIGICGILYCPSLKGVNKNRLHKMIGNAVLKHINDKFNLPTQIVFDENQSQFTLGRSFPVQFTSPDSKFNWNPIKLNENAVEFLVDYEEVNTNSVNDKINPVKSEQMNSDYIFNSDNYNENFNELPEVKIYNLRTNCRDLLLNSGVYEQCDGQLEGDYLSFQKRGKSNKSVSISKYNNFKCFTSSLKGKTSFDLLAQLYYRGDSQKAFNSISKTKECIDKTIIITDTFSDYDEIIPCDEIDHIQFDYDNWDYDPFFIDPLESINSFTLNRLNEIFDSKETYDRFYISENGTFNTETLSAKEMLGITEREIEIAVHNSIRRKGYDYEIYSLLKNKNISSTVKIDGFITPKLIKDNCKSFINYIFSGCGCGKTTAFLGKNEGNINGLAKDKNILFVVPRVVMAEQQLNTSNRTHKLFASTGEEKMNVANGIEYLKSVGAKPQKLYDEDRKLKSGVLTYDQFVMIPNHTIVEYDYVVFDESHLLASDSFRDAIPKTFSKLEEIKEDNIKVKFILLSATPSVEVLTLSNYFKADFKIINIEKKQKVYPRIFVHNFTSNDRRKKDVQIFEQIIKNINEKKKVIIFCENKNKIRTQWERLEKYFAESGISSPRRSFISADSKKLKIYQSLVEDENLNVDVLYTTSVLNVGLNISKGVENGVSFIFDYTTKEGHDSASSQIQLIFRNRKRNAEVHCFEALMQKENRNLFKESESAKKRDSVEFYFENMKSFNVYSDKALASSFTFNETEFAGFNSVSECSISTQSLERHLNNDKRRLDTFVKLALRHGCKMEYILNSDELTAFPITINNTNKFIINVLISFLSIGEGQKIKLISNNQSVSGEINTTFDLDIESMVSTGSSRIFECHYHSTFNSILQSVRRSYNDLLFYYKDTEQIQKVLNFIIEEGSNRKTIDKKLIDYIKRYKLLKYNNVIVNVVTSFIKKRGYVLKEAILENILKTEIPNTIVLHFSETLSIDLISINTNARKVINEAQFHNFFREHIVNKVHECFSKLYKVNLEKNKQIAKLEIGHVLDFEQRLFMCQNIGNCEISDFLYFDKENNTLGNDNLFTSLLERLSTEYPRESLSTHIITDYIVGKNYFDSDYASFSIGSTDELLTRYKREFEEFRSQPSNKRSKFAFAVINHKTEEIVIKKSMRLLHTMLLADGVLNKMISPQKYDYTKSENFYKKTDFCENYTLIKKIDLNNLK